MVLATKQGYRVGEAACSRGAGNQTRLQGRGGCVQSWCCQPNKVEGGGGCVQSWCWQPNKDRGWGRLCAVVVLATKQGYRVGEAACSRGAGNQTRLEGGGGCVQSWCWQPNKVRGWGRLFAVVVLATKEGYRVGEAAFSRGAGNQTRLQGRGGCVQSWCWQPNKVTG